MSSTTKKSQRHEAAQRPVADLARILLEVSGTVIDEPLLLRALTHRSYAYENGGVPHNERQEFLGDAVLGLVVTDSLFRTHPDLPEGQLAKLRASVVNSRALAQVARTLGLGDFVMLGRGEAITGGRDKDSILADTTESIIGTVYLAGGIEAADRLVHYLIDPLMATAAGLGAGLDWKTSLQEATAAADLGVPSYVVTDEGPDHDKEFTATVLVGDEALGSGTGRNKKGAEQMAAEAAWKLLQSQAASGEVKVGAEDAPASSDEDA
ncbi:ribonuclease III [Luteipulveratus mongoliensis]|uniref:Ribonuclease 3 n=1 Tax=Luteipulveratus mongoliensis TaxID=571913 RepID=A0A0K1JI32_9MICO|nr:ribonuclease III [Luteipulveratus mongoliensis]AKU16366.1 ribonuclease III [Luteipulveratus mongoliensis]